MGGTADDRMLWVFTRDLHYVGGATNESNGDSALGSLLLGGKPLGADRKARPWSAAARVERARQLLVALVTHRESSARPARELERLVAEEWAWVCSDRAARAFVVRLAQDLGSADPERVTTETLTRISQELGPLLDLHAALVAHTKRGPADASRTVALANWTVAEPLAREAGDAYLLLLALVREQGQWPTAAIDRSVRTIANVTADVSGRHRLLAAYAEAHAGALKHRPPTDFDVGELGSRAAALTHMAGSFEGHRLLIETAAAFHVLVGTHKLAQPSSAGEGLMHLAQALAMNPLYQPARQRLAEAAELPASIKSNLLGKAITPQFRKHVTQIVADLEDGLSRARAFLAGDRAAALRSQHAKALLAEIANGLAIAGTPEKRDAICHALVMSLERAVDGVDRPEGSDSPDSPELIGRVVAQARTLISPALADSIPWSRVEDTLARAGHAGGWLLAYAVEAPSESELKSWVSTTEIATTALSQWRRWLELGAWLWSGRDRAVKAAAAVGLLLVLHAGGTATLRQYWIHRDEARYSAVLAAAHAGDDAALVNAGRRFLLDGSAGEKQEARVEQVADLYEAALIREIVRLNKDGEQQTAARLLAEHHTIAPKYVAAIPGGSQP